MVCLTRSLISDFFSDQTLDKAVRCANIEMMLSLSMGTFAVALSSAGIFLFVPLVQSYLKTAESTQAIFKECSSNQISFDVCADQFLRKDSSSPFAGY